MAENNPQSVQVSILVPAYNEEQTLGEILDRLLSLPICAEIIVIDDCSTDGTAVIAKGYGDSIVYVRQSKNRGKGAAIRAGLERARGEVTIIQDADLEYFPEDIPAVVRPILEGKADVVYGSRFADGLHPDMALPNRIVNKLLAWTVGLLFFRRVSDEATCYKAFRTSILRRMNLVCNRFEFCPEVTAKAIRLGHVIYEVPIRYEPRSKHEGKKIRWTDGVEAFWTLLRHRFSRF
ncbi:MAG: glycosyltransferase family 2 protein [Armatimonadetes bacterium]|nr:glycosyltransferase family 2 protein [Armatimonadota bacterium]